MAEIHVATATLVMDVIEDHHPDLASWIDDSCWLTCQCGWDAEKTKVGWHDHLVNAVTQRLASLSVASSQEKTESGSTAPRRRRKAAERSR